MIVNIKIFYYQSIMMKYNMIIYLDQYYIKGNNLKWNNDKLIKINDNIIYEYDEKGIWYKKIINNEETTYILNNNQILQMSNKKEKINFRYILNKLEGFTYIASSEKLNITILL